MSLFLVVGSLVISAALWRSLLRAGERSSAGDPHGNQPSLDVRVVIPDTVPPEWVDTYRADN